MPDLQQQIEDLRRRLRGLPEDADPASIAELEKSARALLADAKNTPNEAAAQALFAELARVGNPTSPTAATIRGLLRRARIRIEIAGDDSDIDQAIDILAEALSLNSKDGDVIAMLEEAGRYSPQAMLRVNDLFARHNLQRVQPQQPNGGRNGGDGNQGASAYTPPAPSDGGSSEISWTPRDTGSLRDSGAPRDGGRQPSGGDKTSTGERRSSDPRSTSLNPAQQYPTYPTVDRENTGTRRTGTFSVDDALSEVTQLYYAGDYQQVVDLANRILNQQPNNQAAIDYRQKAEDNLIRGVVPDHRIPFEARVAYNRANSLVRAGNYDEAERLYREARDIAERNGILSWKDAEQALLDIQDLALARELLLEGDRLMAADSWQEAMRKYEGALKVVANDPQAEDRIDKLRRIQQDTEAASVQLSMLSGTLSDQAAQLQNVLGTVTRLRQMLPNSQRLAHLSQDANNRLNGIKSQLTDQAQTAQGRASNATSLDERLSLTSDALTLTEMALKLDPGDPGLAQSAQDARTSVTDMQRARQVIERAAALIAQNFDNELLQARAMLTGLMQYAQDARYRAVVSDLLNRYIERAAVALEDGDVTEAEALLQSMREEPFNILGRRSEVTRLENQAKELRGRTRVRNGSIIFGGGIIIILFALLTRPTWSPLLFPEPTPTSTNTPTATYTFTPSDTPTASNTPTPSDTPTASNTPTPSWTPSETWTPSPTWTPSYTATASITPSETPRPTETFTPSQTPTITNTPTVTPTPTVLCSVITPQSINVRSRATRNSQLVAQLPQGTVARVYAVEQGVDDGVLWYRIETEVDGTTIRGVYVRSDTVTEIDGCPSL
jgi:tetratricopeptide (TPR) repeat protein